jgi:hypothetical protein
LYVKLVGHYIVSGVQGKQILEQYSKSSSRQPELFIERYLESLRAVKFALLGRQKELVIYVGPKEARFQD